MYLLYQTVCERENGILTYDAWGETVWEPVL